MLLWRWSLSMLLGILTASFPSQHLTQHQVRLPMPGTIPVVRRIPSRTAHISAGHFRRLPLRSAFGMAVAALKDTPPPCLPLLRSQIPVMVTRGRVNMGAPCLTADALTLPTRGTTRIAAMVDCGCHALHNDDTVEIHRYLYVSISKPLYAFVPSWHSVDKMSCWRHSRTYKFSVNRGLPSAKRRGGLSIALVTSILFDQIPVLPSCFQTMLDTVKPIQAQRSSHGHTTLRSESVSVRAAENAAHRYLISCQHPTAGTVSS